MMTDYDLPNDELRDPEPEPSFDTGRATRALASVRDQVAHQARVRPYATVLMAAAAGYVLGGGVPRWAVTVATTVATRLVAAQILASLVDTREADPFE